MAEPELTIEVVYAKPHEQTLLELRVAPGTTVQQAIEVSGILETHPEIDLSALATGIFGRQVSPETEVENGDRVEIYRPLRMDPKEARRMRAKKE